MRTFRLLIVEDNDQDLALCKEKVSDYIDERKREIELVACKNVEEAFEKLDNSFDGAIIDMKLGDQGDEGNEVIKRIVDSYYKIPIAIFTGTPGTADSDFNNIGVFTKGETGYEDLLDRFWTIYDTGLTRIMGGRGTIEKTLQEVFQTNILPQIQKWEEYGEKDSSRTEKALLRHILNHLLQLLDDDEKKYFPEEMYLYPPLSEKTCTGSIVQPKNKDDVKSKDRKWYVVMNPACDLVIRDNDRPKTDSIVLVKIEKEESIIDDKNKKDRKKLFGNDYCLYYHWLPKTDFFDGGFLNFRKLSSLSIDEFNEKFEKPIIQIAPFFIKDMVARFSAYYARQGQPDIDIEQFLQISSTDLTAIL